MCLKRTIIKYSNYIIQRWYLNFSHIYKQAIHSIREYIGPLNKVGLMCNECTCIMLLDCFDWLPGEGGTRSGGGIAVGGGATAASRI